jgi:hypothetical protein
VTTGYAIAAPAGFISDHVQVCLRQNNSRLKPRWFQSLSRSIETENEVFCFTKKLLGGDFPKAVRIGTSPIELWTARLRMG